MNKLELLKKYRDMAIHNVVCYSDTYYKSRPRAGYEAEWHAAQAEKLMLDELISEREASIASKEEPKEVPLKLSIGESAPILGMLVETPVALEGEAGTANTDAKNTVTVRITADLDMQPVIAKVRATQKALYRLEDELVKLEECPDLPRDESA